MSSTQVSGVEKYRRYKADQKAKAESEAAGLNRLTSVPSRPGPGPRTSPFSAGLDGHVWAANDSEEPAVPVGAETAGEPSAEAPTDPVVGDTGAGQEQTDDENNEVTLASLAYNYTTFTAQTGEMFALTKNGRVDVVPLQGEGFLRRLKLDRVASKGKVPSKAEIELLRDALIDQAEHMRRPVYKRIALDQGDVIIDLGDDQGRRIRVTAHGWTVEAGGEDILFRRPPSYGVIDPPAHPACSKEAWEWLEPLLQRVPPAAKLPVAAWLVSAALYDADYPIVLLHGPEGSAKSMLAQSLAKVLDPPHGLLPTMGADTPNDIRAGVRERHICVVDNAPARLGGAVENALCQISTGAQYSERQLYTNYEVASVELHAPLVVTAISHPFRQRDTRNRTIRVQIEPLAEGFRRRADVDDEVEASIGKIRGAVLHFLAAYLRDRGAIERVEIIRHRMVDWAIAGEVIARALGARPGSFLEHADALQREDAADYLEGDSVGSALLQALGKWADQVTDREVIDLSIVARQGWDAARLATGEVTISAMPNALCTVLQRAGSFAQGLPASARATTGAVQRLQGALSRAGVQTTFGRTYNARFVTFTCHPRVLRSHAERTAHPPTA